MLNAPIKAIQQQRGSPHVIVVGNEKGGSGKTTVAIHIVAALMKAGQRVTTIDLDSRQRSLTHHIESRRGWARRSHIDLGLPTHFSIGRLETAGGDENEAAEFADFHRAISAVQDHHDFIVIDTPAHDSYLMRLAHSISDTLVTPLNDSFLDFDVLATIDPVTFAVTGISHYGELVREARRHRRSLDGVYADWVVVRNRVALQESIANPMLREGLNELALSLGFRMAPDLHERAIYRNFFPRGLTALDDLHESMSGFGSDPSDIAARDEMQALLEALKLAIDDRGRRRAALRAEWFVSRDDPLHLDHILVEP
jgi:chromosome partitioning protein